MTAPIPGPRTPAPQPPRPDRGTLRWPDPTTPSGAVLYAVIAGLILWLIINILSHIHIIITWR